MNLVNLAVVLINYLRERITSSPPKQKRKYSMQ